MTRMGNSSRSKMAFSKYTRRAHHAGSWYSDSKDDLDAMLSSALDDVDATASTSVRGIICPHAGYSYSGPTAAYSYHALAKELEAANSPVRHLLVLHPSHHVYLDGCAISGATTIETPVGDLRVDDALRDEVRQLFVKDKLDFTYMSQSVDEEEHSGEMQYPYIAKCIPDSKKDDITVLPIMCGNLSTSKEAAYGKCLASIVQRRDVLCIISSDFCHWGKRFAYQPTGSVATRKIHEYIREMDHAGMDKIQLQEPGAFAAYLKATRNTICGRHPIAVWLNAVHHNDKALQKEALNIAWVKYAQSSEVRSMRDSSVSYASAVATKA
uniref:MEMO1 family protein n=1 Tax=Craspedostauros australis TaxID=1486917 RepID=A0A7R9ZN49_9STRA|mmetsp:Transcript_217/g.587  ORF Transcript_217/g.587 Transcript_217/m.587 type:complete len:325 (+) Transcript_217:133-1107(+)